LKCCLRYEFDTYEQLLRVMPSVGSRVMTPGGRARVVGHEILAGQLLVETSDGLRKLVDLSDVTPSSEDSSAGAAEAAPTA
jgi:cell fate regulator YaaT (PSP1 superfamily)